MSTTTPKQNIHDGLLLRDREVARLLGCSSRFVWTLHASGKLPAPIQLSARFVRWRRDELERWIEAGMPTRERWNALARNK